jgi:DNA invertase Pin-like site-specific DNA recombinase
MPKALDPSEVVTVMQITRFARSTFDQFTIVKQIVDAGAQVRSLAEPWADTGTSLGRLHLIRTRMAEGSRRARSTWADRRSSRLRVEKLDAEADAYFERGNIADAARALATTLTRMNEVDGAQAEAIIDWHLSGQAHA